MSMQFRDGTVREVEYPKARKNAKKCDSDNVCRHHDRVEPGLILDPQPVLANPCIICNGIPISNRPYTILTYGRYSDKSFIQTRHKR